MNVDRVKQIIEMMEENNLAEFELEEEDFKIRIRRGPSEAQQVAAAGSHLSVMPAAAATPVPTGAAAPVTKENVHLIKSPMVGTFYRRSSPDAKPYVEVGDEIDEETVVCIIEAMKVMNEIKAECSGVIIEILAENAKPVEFGKPLFKVKPKEAV